MIKRIFVSSIVFVSIIALHQISLGFAHNKFLSKLEEQGISYQDNSTLSLFGVNGDLTLQAKNILPGFTGDQKLKLEYFVDGFSYPLKITGDIYIDADAIEDALAYLPPLTKKGNQYLLLSNINGEATFEQTVLKAEIDKQEYVMNAHQDIVVSKASSLLVVIKDSIKISASTPNITILQNNGINTSFENVTLNFSNSKTCLVLCDAQYSLSIEDISNNDANDPNFYISGFLLSSSIRNDDADQNKTHFLVSSVISEVAVKNQGARNLKNQLGIRDIDNNSLQSFLNQIFNLKAGKNLFLDQSSATIIYANLLSGGAKFGLITSVEFDDEDKMEVDLYMKIPEHSNLANNPMELLNTLESKFNVVMPTKTAIQVFGMNSTKQFIQNNFAVLSNNDYTLSSTIEINEGSAVINGKEMQL